MLNIDKDLTIKLTRGDTANIKVDITDSYGEVYTPLGGDVIRFAMKKSYSSDEVLLNITIPNDTLILEILPQDTANLPFGAYKYDIQITTEDGIVDTFIAERVFIVAKEVL